LTDTHESIDPDLDHISPDLRPRTAKVTTRRPRVTVHRLVTVGSIGLGGATGTLLREWLSLAFPTPTGAFNQTIFGINVSGSFLLGLLLAVIHRFGPDAGWRRRVRLIAGTGVLGGFTTYSAFALGVVSGTPPIGIAYALASIGTGIAAAAFGLWLPRRIVGAAR